MLKMMFLVHRHPDLDIESFSSYWRGTHSEIASMIPGLRKYTQHHAVPGPDGSPPLYDGVAEMWYDDAESLERAMASPEGQAAQVDAEKCMDIKRLVVMIVEQHAVV
jgi:uncharacterized protein (TIGR02118 family)